MKGKKRRRKRPPSEVRAKILNIASQLFAKRGFPNVSIRDICDAAEVSFPLVYYYFRNKSHLFEEVVAQKVSLGNFIKELEKTISRKTQPWEKLRAFIHTYLNRYPEEVITIGFFLRETARIDEEGKNRLVRDFTKIRRVLEKILSDGIQMSIMRKVEPCLASQCILGCMNGFLFRWIHFKETFDRKSTADFLFDFAQKALVKR